MSNASGLDLGFANSISIASIRNEMACTTDLMTSRSTLDSTSTVAWFFSIPDIFRFHSLNVTSNRASTLVLNEFNSSTILPIFNLQALI